MRRLRELGATGATMAGYYLLTGTCTAAWGATLPDTDARLDRGAGRLGTVLLVLGIGATDTKRRTPR